MSNNSIGPVSDQLVLDALHLEYKLYQPEYAVQMFLSRTNKDPNKFYGTVTACAEAKTYDDIVKYVNNRTYFKNPEDVKSYVDLVRKKGYVFTKKQVEEFCNNL